jgi:hypothetical protein
MPVSQPGLLRLFMCSRRTQAVPIIAVGCGMNAPLIGAWGAQQECLVPVQSCTVRPWVSETASSLACGNSGSQLWRSVDVLAMRLQDS